MVELSIKFESVDDYIRITTERIDKEDTQEVEQDAANNFLLIIDSIIKQLNEEEDETQTLHN